MDDLLSSAGALACLFALLVAVGCLGESPNDRQILTPQADLNRFVAVESRIATECKGKVEARILCAQAIRAEARK